MATLLERAFNKYNAKGWLKFVPDETALKILYHMYFGKKLNLDHPQSFSEKLQWLKLHDRNPEYTKMVDKDTAKQYVADRIGAEHIIPTLGVWDRFEDIDFSKLPGQFVLKCTHDSGSIVICKDKERFDLNHARQILNSGLKRNMFWMGREWPYKNVKPRILAEQYMVDESGSDLKDYKVLCFNGEPRLVELHCDRFGEHTQDFYDIRTWEKVALDQPDMPVSSETLERPEFLDEMVRFSALLARDMPHVRVDWYYADHRIYFGEITFFDGSGFEPFTRYEDDLWLGELIHLPENRNME